MPGLAKYSVMHEYDMLFSYNKVCRTVLRFVMPGKHISAHDDTAAWRV